MITADQLDKIEHLIKQGDMVAFDMPTITDVRALMAENVELYAALDKTKKAVSDATELLNGLLFNFPGKGKRQSCRKRANIGRLPLKYLDNIIRHSSRCFKPFIGNHIAHMKIYIVANSCNYRDRELCTLNSYIVIVKAGEIH